MAIPSTRGTGSTVCKVAPVQALIAGRVRTVPAAGHKLQSVVPETVYCRYETLLSMLHWPGMNRHQLYSCGTMYCASAKYVAPGFSEVFKSLTSTRMR